jgi:hypothetical protein
MTYLEFLYVTLSVLWFLLVSNFVHYLFNIIYRLFIVNILAYSFRLYYLYSRWGPRLHCWYCYALITHVYLRRLPHHLLVFYSLLIVYGLRLMVLHLYCCWGDGLARTRFLNRFLFQILIWLYSLIRIYFQVWQCSRGHICVQKGVRDYWLIMWTYSCYWLWFPICFLMGLFSWMQI